MTTFKSLSSLEGKKSLITGAAGNLGRVFADTLAELGSDLILVDKAGTNLQELNQTVKDRWGIKSELHECDLELESERNLLLQNIRNQEINVLVNNAAFVGTSDLSGWAVKFEDQSLDTWRRAMEVNLTAAFHLTQGLYPSMREASGASIINISSMYGSLGPDYSIYEDTKLANPAAYAASKGGLVQLTRWLATTLAPEIRVNAISPGGIYRNQPTSFVSRYEKKTPLQRMGSEDDFRGPLAFLASELSRYTTGQVLHIDGGWSAW
jgi:NAD(P)-dependent dehydrogenase (short-subunit alcohol dehydrogenase family)